MFQELTKQKTYSISDHITSVSTKQAISDHLTYVSGNQEPPLLIPNKSQASLQESSQLPPILSSKHMNNSIYISRNIRVVKSVSQGNAN